MKKQELLNYVNDELLDKLFGFCYSRTNDSYQAEELCSDIVYALVKAAHTDGEIESAYPFIWRVARNVYADFSDKRKKHTEKVYEGDSEEFLLKLADDDTIDVTGELLHTVYKRIAFLTGNPYLYRRAEIELKDYASVTHIREDSLLASIPLTDFDIVIRDTDFFVYAS